MIAIFDIESNGLYREANTLHCISIKVDDEPTKVYTSKPIEGSDGTLDEGLVILQKADCLIGHNIINFDIPVLQKLYPDFTYKDCRDTLLMSRLTYPNILLQDANLKSVPKNLKGSHSLKAWGYRLRKLKGEYTEQWERLTPEMVEYCRQDSEVTYALYQQLLTRNIPNEAIWLEQEFAKIISRQEKYGVLFDVVKAEQMHIELVGELEKAEEELHKVFKPIRTWYPKDYPKIAYKKDGSKSQVLLNQESLGYHFNEDMEWGKFDDRVFSPTSGRDIVDFVEHYFGKQEWILTEKGNPQTGAEHIERMFGHLKWSYYLLKYLIINKLLSQMITGNKAWMKQVKSTGRIYGRVNTLGAVSRRCTHSDPNLAQVPSVKKDTKLSPELAEFKESLGHRCRELFTVPKGKKLVGCDADGLELRTLSHYMAKYDGGKYAKAVDEGKKENGTDIHTLNQKGAGLPTRDDAKTFIYAFLYGAGDGKIGKIINGSPQAGKRLKDKFFRQIPAIKRLVEQVALAYKTRGTLKALDHNPYHIRSAHSALNTLLQGAGALVMKYYAIFADRNFTKKGWKAGIDYEFILSVHDEYQWEVNADIAEDFAKECVRTFDDVTAYLNFRIPLRGTADVGSNWADTH